MESHPSARTTLSVIPPIHFIFLKVRARPHFQTKSSRLQPFSEFSSPPGLSPLQFSSSNAEIMKLKIPPPLFFFSLLDFFIFRLHLHSRQPPLPFLSPPSLRSPGVALVTFPLHRRQIKKTHRLPVLTVWLLLGRTTRVLPLMGVCLFLLKPSPYRTRFFSSTSRYKLSFSRVIDPPLHKNN